MRADMWGYGGISLPKPLRYLRSRRKLECCGRIRFRRLELNCVLGEKAVLPPISGKHPTQRPMRWLTLVGYTWR